MEAAEDPLSALADIHLPAAVSWWPPAPLWWLLAALVLAAIAYGCYLLFLRWQHGQRKLAALAEIRNALALWRQQNATDANGSLILLHQCNSVLKRVALVHYPHVDVAALHGKQWLAFLDTSGNTHDFGSGVANVLADSSYRKQFTTDAATAAALTAAVERWISHQYLHQGRSAAPPAKEAMA